MKIYFDHAEPVTSQITTFYFKPEDRVDYTAGQYMELTLKHAHPDKRGVKRWFTISSPPTDELLSLTTRINSQRSSSFKEELVRMEPGRELHMNGPFGDFVLPKLIQTPLVFVAGGIGITPYHSILSWLREVKETRPIQLLYGVRNEEDIIFQDIFKETLNSVIIVDQPSASWGGERGHLSGRMIAGLTNPTEDTLIYISGPEPMVEQLGKDMLKEGIKKSQLVQDFFPNYPDY